MYVALRGCFWLYTVLECEDLASPANGQVTLNGTAFGSIAIYSCDDGYVLNGNEMRICQSSGEWSGDEPTCES